MKRNDLQTIMRRAWTIARTNGQGFQYLPCQGLEPLPPDAADAGGRGTVRIRESRRYIAQGGGHAARSGGHDQGYRPTG